MRESTLRLERLPRALLAQLARLVNNAQVMEVQLHVKKAMFNIPATKRHVQRLLLANSPQLMILAQRLRLLLTSGRLLVISKNVSALAATNVMGQPIRPHVLRERNVSKELLKQQ
jgi:hypothetical protein